MDTTANILITAVGLAVLYVEVGLLGSVLALLSYTCGSGDGAFLATLLDVPVSGDIDHVRQQFLYRQEALFHEGLTHKRPIGAVMKAWPHMPLRLVRAIMAAGSPANLGRSLISREGLTGHSA